jgi:hypothetical protein
MKKYISLRTRTQASREWRKLGLGGRLYWKGNNWKWRTFFDGDDKAVWKTGTVSMHFKSWNALEEFINEEHQRQDNRLAVSS